MTTRRHARPRLKPCHPFSASRSSLRHVAAGALTLLAAPFASASSVPTLGSAMNLPLFQGGVLTVAVVAIVAGVRIVRARQGSRTGR